MCAEREQGIAIGLGPAHAGPLQEALDEVVGGRLDRPGAEREAVEAEGRVVHALGVGAEVAALELQARGRLGGGRAARSAVRTGAGPCTSSSAARRAAPAASVWQRIVAAPAPAGSARPPRGTVSPPYTGDPLAQAVAQVLPAASPNSCGEPAFR